MNRNLSNEELVSNYLDNELSDLERLDFENRLAHDSELNEEYNFQNDLVSGIKESRRLELKSRLSNIPINTPLYQTLVFKAAAVVSISATVGIGAYYLLSDSESLQLSDIVLEDNRIESVDEYIIPEVPDAIAPVIKAEEQPVSSLNTTPQEKPKEEVIAKNIETESEIKFVEPTVIQPDLVEGFEEEELTASEIEADERINSIDNVKENVESAVEISTVKDKRNRFHYKFFENKLFLLGNFDDMPYEIIELNSSTGKSYFLYYNNSYFKLSKEQIKATPLIKIENDSLVNELKIIQANHN